MDEPWSWVRLEDLQMAVEVDDADGAVFTVHAPEQGKRDGVVASQGDDPGKCLAGLGVAFLMGISLG